MGGSGLQWLFALRANKRDRGVMFVAHVRCMRACTCVCACALCVCTLRVRGVLCVGMQVRMACGVVQRAHVHACTRVHAST